MELNMILSNDFEKIAKRRKNRSLVRNSIISLIISILVLSVSYVGLNRLSSQQGKRYRTIFLLFLKLLIPMFHIVAGAITQVHNLQEFLDQLALKILMELKCRLKVLK